MQRDQDGERVAAALTDWLATLTFVDRSDSEVTALLVDSVAAWGAAQGWRVYRRAPSVMTLPPPYTHRRSCLDVACARPAGAPIAIEIDRTDRRRSMEKLLAEAEAGRIPIWVRWGTGRFEPPPLPIRMVTCQVTSRRGLTDRERLHSRLPESNRPAPPHTPIGSVVDRQTELEVDPSTAGCGDPSPPG